MSISFLQWLGVEIGLYLLLAFGCGLCIGVGGIFDLSLIASYAIGAYTAALLMTNGYSFSASLLCSFVIVAVTSFFLSYMARKLTEEQCAIATLAFASLISTLTLSWVSLTGGALGLAGIPRPSIFSFSLDEENSFLTGLWFTVIVFGALFLLIYKNPIGRFLRSSSEFATGARSLGVPLGMTQTLALILSATTAATSGAFFATYISYIDPSSFSIKEMIVLLTIVAVSGTRRFWTLPLATIVLVSLPDLLRFTPLSDYPETMSPLRQLFYGILLCVFIRLFNKKIFLLKRTV